MVNSHNFKLWLTKGRYEFIKKESQEKGYLSVSAFLRDLIFNRSGFIEMKLSKIHSDLARVLELLE